MLDLPGTPVNGVTNTVIATTSSVTVNATNGLAIYWGAYTSDVGFLFSILVPAGTGITFTYLDDVAGWVVTATSLASVYSIGNNFSTAGQMIVGSGADTATILDPGTDGQYLVADSAQPAGLNWYTIPAPSTPVSFRAHATGGGASASPAGNFYVVSFDLVDWDTNSSYTISTGKYTVPVTGKYLVDGALTSKSMTGSSNRFIASIFKNSVEYSRGTDLTSSAVNQPITSTVTDLVSCTVGDTLAIYYWQNSTEGFQSGTPWHHFSVLQVA